MYLDPFRDPLKVPLHHLHGLRGNFFKVSVNLEDRKTIFLSCYLKPFFKSVKIKPDETRKEAGPAYLFVGFDLRPATVSKNRCRSHQRGRSLEFSHSHQIQSIRNEEDCPWLWSSCRSSVEKVVTLQCINHQRAALLCIPSCQPVCSSEWPRPSPESQRWPQCCDSWCPPHTDQSWAQPGRTWPPAVVPLTTEDHCWHHPILESKVIVVGCDLTFGHLFTPVTAF